MKRLNLGRICLVWDTVRDTVCAVSYRPLDRSKLVRRFKQALEQAEVRRITFHELRHTFGTRMAAAGVPLRTIQHWMGHADSKTTQIYAHYQPSDAEAGTVDQAFA